MGHKVSSISNEDEYTNIEIIGVGKQITALPLGSSLNTSTDKVFLIYDKKSKSYYLRTFNEEIANPDLIGSSLYSYPRGFAKMNIKNITSNVDLGSDLDSIYSKAWLNAFNIKMQKTTPILARNFAGAAWVKNLCLDGNGEKNWRFSKSFIDKLSSRHGEEFNWGVSNYRGRSIILWDTLRDFES